MFQSFFLSRNVVTYEEGRSVVECSMRLSVLIGLAVVLFSGVALADSPHFTSSSGALDGDGNLAVTFKEAGLGSNMNINYVLSADSSANYGCINNGGKNPSASNKRAVSGTVTANATLSSGKNGSVNGTLTVKPPPAPADWSCPGGQKAVVADVSYTNVVLKDATTPVTAPVAGSFTKTFYTFK